MNDIKLDTKESIDKLDKVINENQFKLVIIDSMVRCMKGVENDATDVRNVFNNLKNIIHKYQDVSFIILHHTTKGGKGMDGLRGSGDFAASADCILMFTTKHKGFINTEIVKNRHIDMSEFNEFSISVNNLDNGGIVFGYGEREGFKDLAHSCVDCIKDWFKGIDNGHPLIQFKSSQCIQEMSRYGYKKTITYEALAILVQDGAVKKCQKGVYDVEQSTLTDENK